jgi:membrane protease subunit (stomatin/prohibitin family)
VIITSLLHFLSVPAFADPASMGMLLATIPAVETWTAAGVATTLGIAGGAAGTAAGVQNYQASQRMEAAQKKLAQEQKDQLQAQADARQAAEARMAVSGQTFAAGGTFGNLVDGFGFGPTRAPALSNTGMGGSRGALIG